MLQARRLCITAAARRYRGGYKALLQGRKDTAMVHEAYLPRCIDCVYPGWRLGTHRWYASEVSMGEIKQQQWSVLSKYASTALMGPGLLVPAGDMKTLSMYNRIFTESGLESDDAWASVFPRKYFAFMHFCRRLKT